MERDFPALVESGFPAAARQASVETALLMITAFGVCMFQGSAAPLGVIGPVALGFVFLRLRAFGSARSMLPNAVTALRVLLIAALALWAPAVEPVVAAAAVLLVYVLDGVDGYLARRLDATSQQGAHFDVESDAYLVLTVCTLLACNGLGGWVLLGGLLRYLYVIAIAVLPSRGSTPRFWWARYAFSAALMLLAAALWLPERNASVLLAALATAILCLSFAGSFAWSFAVRAE